MDICTERRLRAQFFLIQTSWLVTNIYMYLCVYTYIVFVLGFLEIEEEGLAKNELRSTQSIYYFLALLKRSCSVAKKKLNKEKAES